MKSFIPITIFLILVPGLFTNLLSQNLVLNPSFETVNTGNLQCSWYTTEAQFTSAISNWDYPNDGSTDVFHTSLATSCYCSPFSTHTSANGPQAPRTGNSMTAIVTYGSGGCTPYREYIQGELSTTLTVGTTYEVSLYVSLADYMKYATNNIGFKFTTTRQNTGSMCVWNTTPDVNYSGTPITDETNWTLLTFTFTPATSGLKYFSIGNFYSDASTTAVTVSGSKSTTRYYIDDVSIVPACSVTANAGSDATTTCTNPSTTLNGSASGGSTPYSYSWSPSTGLSNASIANPTANPSATTTYTLTVTDNSGCTDTDQVTVTVNKTAPTANAGSDVTTNCTTTTASLSASGGVSYSWSPSSGLSSTTSANPTANPSTTTTYTVTATASNGCTDTDQVTVTVDKTPPTANAGSDAAVDCISTSTTLNGSGGVTYSWSPTTGLSNPTAASTNASPTSTTTYTLTVTGSNGCTDTDDVTVSYDGTAPSVNAGSDVTTDCNTPTTTLNGSGTGVSYNWSPSTGLSNANITNPTADPTATTTYTLTATGANGCTSTDQVTVTVDETAPTANAGSDVTTNCTTTTASLSASGGVSYSWSPSSGLSSTTSANPTANPSTTTTYTVTATASNGCTDTDQVTVTVDKTPPTANAGSDAAVDCISTSTTLNGSGGVAYSWSPTTGLSNPTAASTNASPTSTTTYTLTVTGANGCTDTDDVTVSYDGTAPLVNAGSDVTTDCNTPTTTLNGSGTGVSYNWSPSTGLSNANITNPTADPAATTTYTLTATGANGCTNTDQVTVTVDETAPTVNAGADITIDCNTTSASFTATGANSYSWDTPDGTFSTASLTVDNSWTSGTFTVTGTGTNGCSNADNATLTIDTISPIADAGNDQISSCTTPVVTLDGSGSSGTSLSYGWSGGNILSGANTSTATTSTPGTYTLTVTDINGCTNSDNVEVIPDSNLPTADAGADAALTCSQTVLTVGGSGTTTGSNISYTWTTSDGNIVNGSTSANANIDDDGDYTLTVLDNNNGCSSSDNVSITYDTVTPVASVVQDELTLNCSVLTVTADASASSGTNNTYSWTTTSGNIVSGQNTSTPEFDQPGLYQLTVTSDNDCQNLNNTTITVLIDTLTPQVELANSGDFDCDTDTINITAEVDTMVNYLWTGGNIISSDTLEYITLNNAGTYHLAVTNPDNGCSNTASIDIINICSEEIIIPNIFSPNGDNENDVFKINGSHLESLNGTIMNRWGQVLFEWSTVDGGWDGFTLAGVESASGTYYYIITYTTPQGEVITETGPLQLVR